MLSESDNNLELSDSHSATRIVNFEFSESDSATHIVNLESSELESDSAPRTVNL